MIKKTITVLSMLILSAALIWAVWEGNAAAGSPEDFPTGLFASSDLFPKYTLIEITNLEQNTKSRAVIIDNAGSDGLLVKVSPDLAKALAIKTGNTVRVRVSIPPLVAEEGADPVLLSKAGNKHSAFAASSETLEKDSEIISAGASAQNDSEEPIDEQPVQSEPTPPEVSEPVEPVAETEEEIAEPVTVAEVEEPVHPETVAKEQGDPIAEVVEPVLPESENVPAPTAVPDVTEPVESPTQSEYSAEAEQPVPIAPPIQKPPMQAGNTSSEEHEKPVLQVVEIAVPEKAAAPDESLDPVPEVSTPIEPQPLVIDEAETDTEEPMDEPELLAVESEETEEEHSDGPEKETEEPVAEPEIIATEVPTENDDTEDELIESHVMLVPAEPREPVAEYIPIPKEPEKPVVATAPVVTQPAEESYTANVLTKGSFYVQVGRFKDILNVESFVQMYGKQYPVAIEKSSTAKDDFYKVYIGPLQKDERGATLETFQKLGFKDAFLKKAP